MNPMSIFQQPDRPADVHIQALPVAVPRSLLKWYEATLAVLKQQQAY